VRDDHPALRVIRIDRVSIEHLYTPMTLIRIKGKGLSAMPIRLNVYSGRSREIQKPEPVRDTIECNLAKINETTFGDVFCKLVAAE
jgi:hypothetical protein